VKAVDWAGNGAEALTMQVTIDESLVPHSTVTVGGEREEFKAWQAGLVASAAVTILMAVACIAVLSDLADIIRTTEHDTRHQ
jgi:hypothetical protein